ncbi:hypothetical protein [Thermococcus gorgonarius]|uniref:Uncharacterized protein n=1 Tax=Thermococcus gorgonarius TaxID=71997 RepID=A0A2Z2M7K3_THEGO|nr:hypothetical protein [Thermococcus gorgonarius]ASJ01273.1 hypothetical protein A3K92_07165 [Thermococcus gorgonarius]
MALPEIKAILYLEILGRSRKAVEERLESVKRGLTGVRLEVGEIIEDPSMDPLRFSSLVEVTLKAPLDALFRTVVEYSPTMVEVLSPGKIELSAEELSSLLNDLIQEIRKVAREKGYVPAVPDVEELPEPRVGFDDDELWELIDEGRNLLYSIRLRFSTENETLAREIIPTLFLLEGAGVNSMEFYPEGRGLVAEVEAVSPLESLVGLLIRYLPESVKVVEPEIVDITAPELQNCLSDVGSFVSSIRMGEDLKDAYEKDVFSFRLSP